MGAVLSTATDAQGTEQTAAVAGPACARAPPLVLGVYNAVLSNGSNTPKLLGEGGFGSVWQYVDPITGKHVAIKRIRLLDAGPKMAGQLYQHIQRELSIHYKLNHAHIIQLKDVFLTPEDGCLNVVLELVEGGTLFEYLIANRQPSGGLPEHQARWIFQQLVCTLEYLHAKGVSDRGIKLESCMLMSPNGPPLIKVGDFGLSRFGVDSKGAVGAAEYRAPEVLARALRQSSGRGASSSPRLDTQPQRDANGASYDERAADIWSAGVLLYLMLVGKFPFDRNHLATDEERLQTMQNHKLPEQLKKGGRATPAACNLLRQLLQPDPSKRITIEGLKQHPWVAVDMPAGALHMTNKALSKPPPSAGRVSAEHLRAIAANVQGMLRPVVELLPREECAAILCDD